MYIQCVSITIVRLVFKSTINKMSPENGVTNVGLFAKEDSFRQKEK